MALTAPQLLERLQTQGVTPHQLVHQPPPWLGLLTCVQREHQLQTEEELENLTLVYGLADHPGVYLKVMAIQEAGQWDYWHLSAAQPVQQTRYV